MAAFPAEHMDANGERMFRHACALGLEGIVTKRLDKPYNSGRCHEVGVPRPDRRKVDRFQPLDDEPEN